MGIKVNPTVIGMFVIGAIVLAVAGVLLFGGGKFFQEKTPYVIFFDSSVQGLNVGAPVVFRGVQVGQVAKVEAIFDPKKNNIDVKVMVEIVRDVIRIPEGFKKLESPQQGLEILVEHGLRASLQTQSFVTGLLLVNLDFHPNTPIKRHGDLTYPEIPTVPTEMQQLLDNVRQTLAELGKLPLEALLSEALGMLKRINTLLDVPELRHTLVSLQDLVLDARQLLHHTDAQVAPLGTKLLGAAEGARVAMEALRLALVDVQKLARDVDGQIAPLATSAEAATPALKQAEKTMAGATTLTNPDSVLFNDLSHTLKALEEAAKSIRILADSLQRNPESLLRGKTR
jgi:paraquat-inducible protein B